MHPSRLPARATARVAAFGLVAALALAVAACGPSAQPTTPPAPTPAPSSPTAAPAAAKPTVAAPAPTPAAAAPTPAAAAAKPTEPPRPAAPTPAAAAAAKPAVAAATPLRLTIVPERSEARYRAREQLAGRSAPNDAIGTTKDVSGTVALRPDGSLDPELSRIRVDLRTLRSDERRRDMFIQNDPLETRQFPFAEFVPREARGLPVPLPDSGEAAVQLVGDLTVHGVTRPVTWETTLRFAPTEVNGRASVRVALGDFGMRPPRVAVVISIEEQLTLELEFVAVREGAPAAAAPAPAAAPPAPAAGAPAAAAAAPAPAAAAPAPAPVPARCDPTPEDALGPFYVPNAPLRSSVGRGYVLEGVVRSASGCAAIPAVRLEFWLVNAQAQYDDDHRATVLAGPDGRYRFESNPPLPYSGRPPHIHIRASAPGFRTLVTQHYPAVGQRQAAFDIVLVPG